MAELFLLNGLKPAIAPGVKLVKAKAASAFLSALELSAEIAARKTQREKEAEAAYALSREEGYKEGLASGRDEFSLKILDTVMASVEYLEKLEGDLANIVLDAVRKIIGQTPPDQVAVGLVKKALAITRDDRRVIVRVSPEDEPAVRRELQGALSTGAVSFLEVKADGRLKRGDCVLESDLGVVEASVDTQLKNLSTALNGRIQA
jgi:type III secretion protein L